MNMNQPEYLQAPFVQRHLLDRSDFVKFCKSLGITVSDDDLIFFEKSGLLYPAVRVYLPIIGFKKRFVSEKEFQKLDVSEDERPEFYEIGGMFIMRNEDWLDGYEYYFPASQRREFEEREARHYEETTNVKTLGHPSVAFYMPQQALLVGDLCTGMTIRVMPSAFSDIENKRFDGLVESMKMILKSEKEFAQLHAWKLYRKLNILNIAVAAEVEREKSVAKSCQRAKDLDGVVFWDDYRAFFDAWDERERVEFVEKQLLKLDVHPQEILQVIEWLETKAGWKDPIINLRPQIKRLIPDRESKGEKDALFAFTCLDWINKLRWACAGTSQVADQDLVRKMDALGLSKTCLICGTIIQPIKRRGRPNADTCGKVDCVRKMRALKLRDGKATGKYKYVKKAKIEDKGKIKEK